MMNRTLSGRFLSALVATFAAVAQSNASAADLTMTSGFFQKSNTKIEGTSKGSTSLFSLGGRYSDDLNGETSWLGEVGVKMRSYNASGGGPTPDDSVGLSLAGGARYYFKPFAEAVVPYVSGIARIMSDKTATWTTNGYVQTTTSGLYYGANAGIRTGLGGDFFVELEIPFFESPLFAVTKTESVARTGGTTTSSKEENTETALYVSSVAKITEARIGLGMKL